jgi:hypothetical protein
MSTRAVAHGKAAREVFAWLHRRKVMPISMHAEIGHDAVPEPRTEAEIHERIRFHLAAPAARMIHEGGTPETHVDLADPSVEYAALLAGRLPGNDPVDHLEREMDNVIASLRSPRIWHAVKRLAAVLIDRRSLDANSVAAVIKSAMLSGAGAKVEPHPRRITLMPGAPPERPAVKPVVKRRFVLRPVDRTPGGAKRVRPGEGRRT